MKLLASVEELLNLRDWARSELAEREKKVQVKVHLGTCGISSGANRILQAFLREVEARRLSEVIVSKAACIGLCGREPVVTVIHPANGRVIYCDLAEEPLLASCACTRLLEVLWCRFGRGIHRAGLRSRWARGL